MSLSFFSSLCLCVGFSATTSLHALFFLLNLILCGMYSTLFLFLFFPVKTLSGLQFLVRSLDSLQDGSKFSFAGTSSRSISLFFLSWNWCVVYYVFFVSAYRSSEVHY